MRVGSGFDPVPGISDAAPFDHTYFVHVGDGLNDAAVATKADEVAGHLFLAASTSASFDFRAWRTATPIHQGEPARLRMLGFCSHHAGAYNAAFQESSSLCTVLLRKWCGAVGRMAPEQHHNLPVELSDTQTLLTELSLTETTLPEQVMTFLRGECGHELESFAAEINTRLTDIFPAEAVTHGQTLDFLQEELSRKEDTPGDRRTLHGIVSNFQSALATTSEKAQETIVDHLRQILNSHHRLEGARTAAHFTAGELKRTQGGWRSRCSVSSH